MATEVGMMEGAVGCSLVPAVMGYIPRKLAATEPVALAGTEG